MVIRWQPLHTSLNSLSPLGIIDREFDLLSRQLESAFRNAGQNIDRKATVNKVAKDSDRSDHPISKQVNEPEPTQAPIAWRPVVELRDAAENIELRFFLPGVIAENVDIQVTKEAVTVSGDRPAPENKEGAKIWTELRYGRFSRTVKLPVAVVNHETKADFVNGTLTLTLPKMVETLNQVYKLSLGKNDESVDLPLNPDQAGNSASAQAEQPEPATQPTSEAEKTWSV